MLTRFFEHIRAGVKAAVLCGFQDAADELQERIDGESPKLIESPDSKPTTNGKTTRRRTAAAK